MLDVVIRNGRIVDGTGNPWFPADLGIQGDRIVVIGNLASAEAERSLDAQGLVVCPGFIDLHTHSDITLLVNPAADSTVRQGITTVVVGNCGHSAAPVRNELIKSNIIGYRDEFGVDIGWRTLGGYFERLEQQGIAVNVASLVGHGAIRIAAMGFAGRQPTADEMRDMKDLLTQALEEGAMGLSSGLEYTPGKNAKPEELVELCRVVAAKGGFYATHTRVRDGEEAIAAMREAADTAEAAGVPLHLSHITLRWSVPRGTERALAMVDELRARGHDTTCDVVPLTWGPTTMAATLPAWAFEGGVARTLERLRDPATRARIKAEKPYFQLQSAGKWDCLMLMYAEKSPEFIGKTFDEIARLRGLDDPYDAVLDILLAEGEGFYNVLWMGKNYSEEDGILALRHPTSSIVSDAINLAPYGPLAKVRWHPHSYGFIADVFENWVGKKRALSMEEAVRKLTSAPALRLGLRQRGLLREGMAADVTVFDPFHIRNNATYVEPSRYPTGIEYVLVNGRIVVEKGEHKGVLAGKVLRRN